MDLAGSVFLIASNGRMLSLPIASESPNDPLSWAKRRRIFIVVILLLHSALSMFLIETPGNLYKAFAKDFDEKTLLQIIDLTFIDERPIALATFWACGGSLAVSSLGFLPMLMDTASEWRPLFKAASIPAAIIAVVILFFVPETYFQRPPIAFDGRVLVQSGTEKVKIYDDWFDVPGRDDDNTTAALIEDTLPADENTLQSGWRVSPFRLWRRSIANPKAAAVCVVQIFLCLANPLVFWVALLNAINFGGMMSIGTGFPVVMAAAPYNLSPEEVGRVNFTTGLTSLLALPASYYMLNNIMKRLTLRNRGVRHAEFYLPAFVLPVTTGAASVFLFGFAAERHWPAVVYHVAYGLNSFSFISGSIANTIWVTESLPQLAAPAIAVVGGVSYMASWSITAVLPMWDESWGLLAVNVFIGVGILLIGLLAIPIAFWGRSVRQFIRGRWAEYEAGALRPQSKGRA
ncbi:hypothetical protein M406DRAFT_340946 [Cryphonectria parasitica EP155]|uniref:Major facilitator superfamily (MFS) profile domain-containing protein n=1 Tax=Cryphonectria parasitica (strain ATCC 38755 / EP155) TaxID=660469 RepID=A0A9P4XZE7_CRYP1|nr:uncharacterized protein M406DRAFT_340946 [Cryphonectria parasitica EP155]KAF3763350.1 hypothetical protein M406DRAFT_340946 [Cryphonectria parasitica EP155]